MESVEKEHWYRWCWRPTAAIVFLTVVVFDFIIMPTFINLTSAGNNYQEVFNQLNNLDKEVQVELVKRIDIEKREWEPLTLQAGGVFYACFGAILGVSAWTRGQEKIKKIDIIKKPA